MSKKHPAMTDNESYAALLAMLKERILVSRQRASLSVNTELIVLYWEIGTEILKRQVKQGWGAKVIDRLATDLRSAFPAMKGFSPRNLKYMREFAKNWPDLQIVQQLAAQLPWFHHCLLLDKLDSKDVREWYVHATIEHGWSRAVLQVQVESRLHERQGKTLSNFSKTLPSPQSNLAQNILKDPYCFDFLSLGEDASERDLEDALVAHVQKFLLELGVGFAFVGRQYHIPVHEQDFFIDLLFYHLRLRCFIVIELKVGDFKPEYIGKMNFYLSAVDDNLRHSADNPSIGLILCKNRNRIVVEYALRDISKPMGVAEWRTDQIIPQNLKGQLPTIEELERELRNSPNL